MSKRIDALRAVWNTQVAGNGGCMEQVGVFLGGATEFTERRSLVGEPAPEFQLQDEDGNNVTLRRMTRRGPVIIHFYRGHW